MALTPCPERVDHRPEALADVRQGVFDPRRYLGIDLADHKLVVLERAKLLGQHALGNPGHPPPQYPETLGAGLQVEQDHAFPLAVDQIERCFDRAARPMGKIPPFHEVFLGFFPIVSKQGLVPRIYSTCQVDARATVRQATLQHQAGDTGMKAVGYKKSLPIEDADSLIDFEAAKPEPKG